MAARMPILRQHHVLEASGHPIDQRHDLITLWHGKSTARAKIILDIYDQ
jgi:hypothetical protein